MVKPEKNGDTQAHQKVLLNALWSLKKYIIAISQNLSIGVLGISKKSLNNILEFAGYISYAIGMDAYLSPLIFLVAKCHIANQL